MNASIAGVASGRSKLVCRHGGSDAGFLSAEKLTRSPAFNDAASITVRVSRLVLDWLRCVGIAPAGEVTVSDGARLAESRCCDLGRP